MEIAVKPWDRSWRMLVVLAGIAWSNGTDAQPSDRVLAQTLFEEGRELMKKGDYAHACPKLTESHKLDPAGGTLLNLALCYEAAGKTASAWAAFEEARIYARKDNRPKRERIAREHIAALEPNLCYLTVVVPDAARVDGMEVLLAGRAIPQAAWGTKMPVDPGPQSLQATAPGRKSWTQTVTIAQAKDQQSVEVPVLETSTDTAPPPAPRPTPTTSPVQPSAPPATPPDTDSQSRVSGGADNTLAYVVGGTGIVLLGVGSYFGLKAMSTWDDRNAECPDGQCTKKAKDLGDDANTQANISNVTMGLGLVGVGFGTYLLLTGDSDAQESAGQVRFDPVVGREGAGLSVGGAF